MDDTRSLRTRGRVLRGPFGDIELRWRVRRPRTYYSAETIQAPERRVAEPVLTAPKETTWIEIKMVDEEGEPVPNERYEITLPDGSVHQGTLNFRGRARIDDIEEPGDCSVTFPDLDADAWERL